MTPVAIRAAGSKDVERIVEIINGEPGDDAIALMGSLELAHRYRRRMVELERIPSPSRVTVVAEVSGRVVGLLQYRVGDRGRHGRLAHLRVLVSLVGPIGIVRRVPALWARTRVGLPIPAESFYVTNVHVETGSQGQGIGSHLLKWAEQEAIRLGVHLMTLNATLGSSAIRLYERNGFAVTRTATHPSYERHLEVPGRVLMEKELTS